MSLFLHTVSVIFLHDEPNKTCSGSERIPSPFAVLGSSDPVFLPVENTSLCSSACCVREDDVPGTVTPSLVA